MAFSDFKSIAQVQSDYAIRYEQDEFIRTYIEIEPSQTFVDEFEFNRTNYDIFASEAARTNLIVTPILREIYKRYSDRHTLFIQKRMNFDKKLSGAPDYLLTKRSQLGVTVLGKPVLIAVEAKHSDFEQGWGQCLAEMVAAQKINNNPTLPIYGIVTDGESWRFGRLASDLFVRNRATSSLGNLPELFGILNKVFEMATCAEL